MGDSQPMGELRNAGARAVSGHRDDRRARGPDRRPHLHARPPRALRRKGARGPGRAPEVQGLPQGLRRQWRRNPRVALALRGRATCGGCRSRRRGAGRPPLGAQQDPAHLAILVRRVDRQPSDLRVGRVERQRLNRLPPIGRRIALISHAPATRPRRWCCWCSWITGCGSGRWM